MQTSLLKGVFGSLDILEGLLENSSFHDVKIKLTDGEVGAHRAILAQVSEVFSSKFALHLASSSMIEISTIRVIDMRIFLRWLYTGQVNSKDWIGSDVQEDNQFVGMWTSRKSDIDVEITRDCAACTWAAPPFCSVPIKIEGDKIIYDPYDPHDPHTTPVSGELRNGHIEWEDGITWDRVVRVPIEALFNVMELSRKYMVLQVYNDAMDDIRARLQEALRSPPESLASVVPVDKFAVRDQELDVRDQAITASEKIATKSFKDIVYGDLEGGWVKLCGEPGFVKESGLRKHEPDIDYFQKILRLAILRNDATIRTTAVSLAAKCATVKRMFVKLELCPEIQTELQAVWHPFWMDSCVLNSVEIF